MVNLFIANTKLVLAILKTVIYDGLSHEEHQGRYTMIRMTTDERAHMALALNMRLTPERFGEDDMTTMIGLLMDMVLTYEANVIENDEGD